MSGSGRNNEKEGEGGGGWGTFWKVAGAAAVVAGGIYSIAEHMEAKRVPVGAGGGGGRGGGIGGSGRGGCDSGGRGGGIGGSGRGGGDGSGRGGGGGSGRGGSGGGIGGSGGRGGGIGGSGGSGRGGCDTIDSDGDSDSDSDSDDDGGGDRGIYSIIVGQMEANRVPVEAGGSGVAQPKVWTKPKVGWLKLNVDGSLLREIQSAGCGGVLRNNSGSWICGFAQKFSPSSREDETEKKGILKGLQWAKEKGFMRVEVESDNEGIVEKVNSWSRSTDPLILAIRELLRSPDWQTTLTWIPGGANRVADKLADIASKKLTSYDLKEFDDPPSSCLTALADDLRFAKRVLVGAAGGGGGGIDGDSDDDGGGDRGRYSIIVEQMEANRVPVEAGGSGVAQPKVWTKPEVGWLKLNVDGSLRRKTQLAGCGGVLRDDSGNWVKGFAQKLDSSLNEDETEREGILRGLKWAKEWAKKKGVRKLEVESDNQGIVDMVNDGTKSKDTRIVDIREELLRSRSPDWQTTLTWIPGVANGVADKLADIGRNLTSDDLKEYDDPPPGSCRTAFNNDFDQC